MDGLKAVGSIGGREIVDLPPSSYAYCEPDDGRSTRQRCHFPIKDANGKDDPAHVRNALARLSTSPWEAKARPAVEAAAKRLGIGQPAQKAWTALKAEDLSKKELESWLSGERSRRILVVPFGGPLPGGKAGVDLDGDYFDEVSDLFGPPELFPKLHATRERMVDWHHDEYGMPSSSPVAGRMKGAILGHIRFDDEPEEDGLWAEWWANAGERRMSLIKSLARREVPIYGSTEAVPWAVKKANDGHIDVWPIIRHTISTSPQNTFAVIPPLKALLTESAIDGSSIEALQAAIEGLLDAPGLIEVASLSFGAEAEAIKAGRVLSAENEAALNEAIAQLGRVLAKIKRPDATETDTEKGNG